LISTDTPIVILIFENNRGKKKEKNDVFVLYRIIKFVKFPSWVGMVPES